MSINVNDPTASGMILTFDDEFNSNSTSNDNAASGTKWSNHWWFDSPNPGAVSLSNGVLNLASNGELSSVNSAGQGFAQKYGYFEIDMKLPAGVGTWPAFFLMSQQHAVSAGNPASEIDIIEAQGNRPNGYFTTLHSATGSGHDTFNPSNTYTGSVSATPLSAGYHSFGLLWAPNSNQIVYYLDGNPVATATKYSTTDYSPDMLLIDNALGDIGLGGNGTTPGKSYGALQIDNVRVYQFAGQGATAVAAQPVSAASGQADAAMSLSASGGKTGTAGPVAAPPSLNVADPSGDPGSAIPLSISAAQASNTLAAAHLTVTVSNLNGATLNHGTLANGVYTLHAADLPGLTVTPAPGFIGTLALHVTATDTEPSSTTAASSATETLDVTVTAPTAASSNGTVVAGTHGDIVTAAGHTFAINAAGQITENGAALGETNSVTELAYVNHTLYQEATSQHLWWSFNETTHQWTQTGNPIPGGPAGGTAPQALAAMPTLNVSVNAPATTEALMQPSFSDASHNVYLLNSLSTGNQHIASFNPASDILDLDPLLKMVGYKGTNPFADHVINLEPASNGGTAVMLDPTGTSPTHGTTVVTLDHVLPHSVPATDIWH